ncbi:MAG: hypothetical protein ACTHOD_15340 [Motilibacteraceae bacterium]
MTEDDLDRILWGDHPPRTGAEILQAWADEPHELDEVGQADLLIAAAGQWDLSGDPERAVDCCRRALAIGGAERYLDPRVHLHGALLDADHLEEAAELERAMRRTPPSDPTEFNFVGESYESRGDLRTAARWYTIGLDRMPEDRYLAIARFRVRRKADLPLDAIDEEALEDYPEVLQRWLDDPGA